jgi:hypothetical protein
MGALNDEPPTHNALKELKKTKSANLSLISIAAAVT